MIRTTVIVEGQLALRMARVAAARERAIGREILTMPLLAARLAGGFSVPASSDILYAAIQKALAEGNFAAIGPVALLPGMPRAVLHALEATWRSDLDLSTMPADTARFADLLAIEARVRAQLPTSRMLPRDLRDAALDRLEKAGPLLGSLSLRGVVDVDQVWRPLLEGLVGVTDVSWQAPPGVTPEWFKGRLIPTTAAVPASTSAEVSADPRAEVVEALRWARQLLASGKAKAAEIAIAATSPQTWDDHVLFLASSGQLPLHFVHGVPALSTTDGQTCAALADVLLSGLNQERVWRLIRRLPKVPFAATIPSDWFEAIPREAALPTPDHWRYALRAGEAAREDGDLAERVLMPMLELLAGGADSAGDAGRALLSGSALTMWDEALQSAPPQAVAISLSELRVSDGRDPGNSIVWCPASQLAASPRPWTRLLGLTSRSWPRSADDDPLVPDHLLPREMLRPVGVAERDRLHFEIIRATTNHELVLSRPQRNPTGGVLSPSALWKGDDTVHKRDRVPAHAFSESDRLLARPRDAGENPRVQQSRTCWRNWWHEAGITPHDGMIVPSHPAIISALGRVQSTTSLQRLLRDPLGFVWRYALGWRATRLETEPLQLDPLSFGFLVHELIGGAIAKLEPVPGFARASSVAISEAIAASSHEIALDWPRKRTVPPPLLWRQTIAEAARRIATGLAADGTTQADTRTWTELPFGTVSDASIEAPWDISVAVPIAKAGISFGGRIDRLDVRGSGAAARITDYKTGQPPNRDQRITLAQGRELQRVLYAVAVRSLLQLTSIHARLVYLGDEPAAFTLKDEELDGAIEEAVDYLTAAVSILTSGRTAPRWEKDATYDDMRLALPADREVYLRHKTAAFADANQALQRLWRTAT